MHMTDSVKVASVLTLILPEGVCIRMAGYDGQYCHDLRLPSSCRGEARHERHSAGGTLFDGLCLSGTKLDTDLRFASPYLNSTRFFAS